MMWSDRNACLGSKTGRRRLFSSQPIDDSPRLDQRRICRDGDGRKRQPAVDDRLLPLDDGNVFVHHFFVTRCLVTWWVVWVRASLMARSLSR
jgi:hypothetical protein